MPTKKITEQKIITLILSELDLKRSDPKVQALRKRFNSAVIDVNREFEDDEPPFPQPEVFPICPVLRLRPKGKERPIKKGTRRSIEK